MVVSMHNDPIIIIGNLIAGNYWYKNFAHVVLIFRLLFELLEYLGIAGGGVR